MPLRSQQQFNQVPSTAPSFEIAADDTSTAVALESTGVREWSGPSGRAVRVANGGTDDYHVNFGDSNIVAASSDSILLLAGTVEIFQPQLPSVTHIAVVSSTDVDVNVTLGYGG